MRPITDDMNAVPLVEMLMQLVSPGWVLNAIFVTCSLALWAGFIALLLWGAPQ